jgi:uncharacterized protein DUF4230
LHGEVRSPISDFEFERLFWGEQPPFMSFGRGGRYFFGLMELDRDRTAAQGNPRRLGWPAVILLTVLILASLAAFGFWQLENWPARTAKQGVVELEHLGREARDAFVQLAHLQPRVTVNNRVYIEQTTSVAELSVITRSMAVEHEMMHSWAGSTKRIKLHGNFVVKAGFDLRKKFTVNIQPNEIVIELPHAQVLSVEQQKVEVLTFENGLWNRISPDDIQAELAVLPRLARERAASLPAEAEQTFTRELEQKFHPPQPVRAVFPPISPSR